MQDTELFTLALGLSSPWEVTQTHLDTENKRLDIHLDFAQGSRFTCGVCADAKAAPYDSKQKTWRHLNFFQYEAYLHARVPRVACPNGCRVHQVEVPWARTGSGFTLLFEAWLMLLFKDIAVSRVGELVNEHDTRLWRVLKHYVSEGRKKEDFSEVKEIGVDETSCKKGRDYISVFCDLDKRRVIYATQGKDASTVKAFTEDLEAHKGVKENIEVVSCDMSPAFISGVNSELKDAQITFDRFHVMKVINDAVNSVRVAEVKDNELLKGTRYVWLKNANKLSKKQQATVDSLSKQHLKTARAYQIKLSFQGLYEQADRAAGEAYLKRWYYWATHSRIGPIIAAAKTIKAHWEGILNWFDSGRTNALLEGINSLIQAAKSKARGYRNKENFIAITYLIGAKLNFDLPT